MVVAESFPGRLRHLSGEARSLSRPTQVSEVMLSRLMASGAGSAEPTVDAEHTP